MFRPEHLKVADVGCGEARLAADVKQPVYSFDLCQFNDAVTVANMTEARKWGGLLYFHFSNMLLLTLCSNGVADHFSFH